MAQFNWIEGEPSSITVNGKQLEAICYGPPPGEAPTIIMLHEGLGCVALWRDFPQKLSRETGFGVFVYSRTGYGKSDLAQLPRPLNYMTREAADILPQVLNAIGFQRGILLGHSDGASIAAIYAGSVSDQRIRGLVLIAPHFFTEPQGLASIREAKEIFATTDMKQKMVKYHNNPQATFEGWNDAWLHPDFKDWNIADAIDHWRIPVLAVQGKQDQYGTLAQIDEIKSRIYSPLEVTILENCKHSPHLEKPQETLATISDFCTTLERLEQEQVAL